MPLMKKMFLREMDGHPFQSIPNYDFLSGNGYSTKQLVHSNSDRDSSSTKSEQSHQDLSAVSDSSLRGRHTPTQSGEPVLQDIEDFPPKELGADLDAGLEAVDLQGGTMPYADFRPVVSPDRQNGPDNNNSCGKRDQGLEKSVLSLGNPESAFSPPKFDYVQPFGSVSYSYAADPYYGGFLTGYTSNAIVHPQISGTANARVPLPVEPAAEEPIFVNAKQYHAILRRRQMRAKLEAQNKLVKGRKPYLHESRHRHAMKRARGSGGRFLNKKELQEQQQEEVQTPTGGVNKMAIGRNVCTDSNKSHSPSTPTSSEISTVSNGGRMLARQESISFSSTNFLPSMNFRTHDEGEKVAVNGMRYCAPIVR